MAPVPTPAGRAVLSSPPANVLRDETGQPLLDEDGAAILEN